MIDIDDLLVESVDGSVTPAASMTAWQDGALTYPVASSMHDRLDVLSWRTIEDATQSTRTVEFTVAAQDPVLVPDSLDGILAPFFSEVNLRAGVDFGPDLGTREASEGWFRLDRSNPREWSEYYPETDEWRFQGLVVDCAGTDRMKILSKARFENDPSYSEGSTVWAAIAALCRDLVPVGVHQVADAAINRVTFETDDRVAAIQDIAKRADARAVFSRDGQLILKPRMSGTGSWTVPEWSLVSVQRELSDDSFYNAVIAKGRNPDTQEEYVGRFYEGAGPARYRTGLKVPYFYSSPLLTTQAATDAAAKTTFYNVVKRREAVITISTPTHYGLEVLDQVTFSHSGRVFSGQAKRIEKSSGAGTMLVDVWLPLADARRLA